MLVVKISGRSGDLWGHRLLVTVCCLFALWLLAACEKTPRISPLDGEAVILAFGDSLTHGTGAGAEETYPAVLAGLLGREVVNAGVPGEVAAAGLKRLPELLAEYQPALVILCHGGNDFLRRLDREVLIGNLREMIALCQESGAEVLLVGVPQVGLFLSADPLYGELAEEFALPYEEKILAKILSERELKSDQIHPNGRGYALLAEKLAALIAKAGGI
ncbi:arylesterase [Desulfuromonas acetexigens]|uniref:Arylesterase n=1 Tax=Trichloromonas acetexigens TaxID=38815 RepID=A0A550JBI6_9BACT|nr:arylesterase [Desulfuromonas acetexigens]